ncbi:fatty acid 2-hydroxylase [Harpegnathos saltator]|uniref:Fatty acid 2-hydroxylase n=1 Tax=Harpegnathos saltator TaxID=610380 RepID=E2C0E4_HARSA|nr:fatty acid 2-hydroxylase [Harpegnathos saltator]EFN78603.1 Fatty acid 2-hydroxylase [Harpegnathos saltator]
MGNDEAMNIGAIRANKAETCQNTKRTTEFLVKYRDRIYDINNFLNYHPGGKNTLARFKGKILDKALARHSHSKSAYYLLEEFAVHRQERYNEYEDPVNWDAPILQQVSSMGHRYWEWVNLPVNRPIRLFQSDILEILSVTPWYLVPIIWIPIFMYFFYMGCVLNISTDPVVSSQRILLPFTLGILIWTVMEYFVHRKIFHLKPPHNSRLLIILHFLFHGNHHKAPFDGRRLMFPPTFSVIVAGILWQIYKILFSPTMLHLIAAGNIMGYLSYDLMHYYLHNGAPRVNSYLYTMKRKHNYHHFIHHNRGFGVTSELWDRLFKTNLTLRKLDEPLKW